MSKKNKKQQMKHQAAFQLSMGLHVATGVARIFSLVCSKIGNGLEKLGNDVELLRGLDEIDTEAQDIDSGAPAKTAAACTAAFSDFGPVVDSGNGEGEEASL